MRTVSLYKNLTLHLQNMGYNTLETTRKRFFNRLTRKKRRRKLQKADVRGYSICRKGKVNFYDASKNKIESR